MVWRGGGKIRAYDWRARLIASVKVSDDRDLEKQMRKLMKELRPHRAHPVKRASA